MIPFSIPFRDTPYESYWGLPTSNTKFCEEDFIVTPYIAEFVNCWTNLIYFGYALHRLQNQHPDTLLVARLPYFGLAAVGVCSALFHAQRMHYGQFADEVSMHLATSIVLHRITTFDKSRRTTQMVGLGLTTLITAFLVYHYFMDDFTVHAILFGSMVWYTGFKTSHVVQQRFKDDEETRKRCSRLALLGLGSFATGYGLWNLDFVFCSELNSMKRAIGMPWSFVLEFHGWWHVLTCFGAYICMALVEVVTQDDIEHKQNGGFLWPAAGYLLEDSNAERKAT